MKKNYSNVGQTKCIDDCICPYCGHKFDGQKACNYSMQPLNIECPACSKEMSIDISVEFICTVIDN